MAKRFSKTLGKRTHANTHCSISTLNEEEGLISLTRCPNLLSLILDQVQDPRNLGACLRSADGAGVNLVVIPSDRSVGLTDVVRHVAAGAAESIPLMRARNLARLLEELRSRNIRLLGTSDQATSTLYEVDCSGPIGLVMGAEGTGCEDSRVRSVIN